MKKVFSSLNFQYEMIVYISDMKKLYERIEDNLENLFKKTENIMNINNII